MKGRRTSFQRFGSMVGVQGSALNKWPRGYEVRRDMDTPISSSPPTDRSDGKGIYNLTLKSNDKLEYTPSEADMGEEVYGCITSGYTKNQKAPQIEYNLDTAITNRQERKAYEAEKYHFSSSGRIWASDKERKQGGVDSSCIPTENVPLVANSKFEMKFWDESEKKMVEVPKGAGFTSGTLVRPVAFSKKAGELKDGSLNANLMRSHVLKAVPIKAAHAILNRCKEIVLTGSVNYSVERTNKKCSGVETSKQEYKGESGPRGCPPGSCADAGSSSTLTCVSTKLTTKVLLNGDISMTAYRYKQLKDIWDEPETLDISGNYLEGRQGEYVGYSKVSDSTCEPVTDSIPVKLPIPQIEQLAEFEKQTKLSSGCLTYPSTNSSMLNATLEDNLKIKEISIENCMPSTAITFYNLTTAYREDINYYWNFFTSNVFPSGVDRSNSICPNLTSGPSLRANFLGIGWDFSGVGKDEPEDAYSKDCSDKESTNFYNYKGKWISTGITRTIESGECPLGITGLDRYDADTEPVEDCKCDDGCEDCKKNYGEVRLVCNCQPMCTPNPNPGNPCKDGEIKGGCDGTYQIAMEIGKYVGVEIDSENQYHNVAAIPLSAKMDTKTEDLTIWWNGAFSQPDASGGTFNNNLGFHLNQASAKNSNPPENSVIRWENKEIGTLTIVCDDWSVGVPLWGQVGVAKETTCKGIKSGCNTYSTSKDAGNSYCTGCEDDLDCCSNGQDGCGGPGGESDGCCNSEFCDIDDPCGYAVKEVSSRKCKPPSCGGKCSDQDGNECGCCNCDYDDQCDPCPAFITCKAIETVSEYEEMGCYGDAHEEDKHEAEVNLTLEFKLFTETE